MSAQPRPSQALAASNATGFVCRHCQSTRSVVRYTFAGVDKVIRQCSACKLMVLDPLPTETELRAVYNDGYFENEQLIQTDVTRVYGYVDYISERINKQRGYTRICRVLNRFALPATRQPLLLDYGCGLGFFLDHAFEAGFDVTGVEFNDYARAYIRKRYAHPVLGPDALDQTARYDIITMFDVIEHLREPFETLRELSAHLNDNGLLVVSTMDSTSLVSRLMGKRLEDFRRISEHLFFFNRANLTSILSDLGFDVVEVDSLGHSFELRLLASRLRAVLPIVGAPLALFVKLLPAVGNWSVYLNPRTKFIAYARKRQRPVTTMPPDHLLSIVVPVCNDGATLDALLTKLQTVDVGMRVEILVVDDGSTDMTPEILARHHHPRITVIAKPHQGKGAAVAAGVGASRGDYLIIQDADGGYDPADIKPLLAAMAETGALAVYGSRYSGRFRRTGGFMATLGNNLLTLTANVLNNLNLSDLMTGYKLFDGPTIRALRIASRGAEFEAEVTCRLRRRRIPIIEAPISYNSRSPLEGKKTPWRDGWRVFRALFFYSWFAKD